MRIRLRSRREISDSWDCVLMGKGCRRGELAAMWICRMEVQTTETDCLVPEEVAYIDGAQLIGCKAIAQYYSKRYFG